MPSKRETFIQTIRAQYLGQQMRALREERGLTLKFVAEYLGVEFSTLARYERAEWPFRREHVRALLDVYGVYEEHEREALTALANNVWRINRWDYIDATPHDREAPGANRTWLDKQAEEVHIYGGLLIPDLLQTQDYAHAIIQAHTPDPRAATNQLRTHIQRQDILLDKPPTRMYALIEEAALTRPVGGRRVLQAQLEQLVRTSQELPHVEIRVLPTNLGLHAGVHGAFTVYKLPRPYPEVAYVEHLGGQLYMESALAERHTQAHDDLRQHALSDHDSIALMTKTAEQLG